MFIKEIKVNVTTTDRDKENLGVKWCRAFLESQGTCTD